MMKEIIDDYRERKYSTRAFCQHWGDADCGIQCGVCGHECGKHRQRGGNNSECSVDGCACEQWKDPAL